MQPINGRYMNSGGRKKKIHEKLEWNFKVENGQWWWKTGMIEVKSEKFNVSMHKNTSHHRKPFHTHCIESASTLGNSKMDPVQILYATRMNKNMMKKNINRNLLCAFYTMCRTSSSFHDRCGGWDFFLDFLYKHFSSNNNGIYWKSHKIIQWIRKK